MKDIRSRLEMLGRIECPSSLDARIESLIAGTEADTSFRRSLAKRIPNVVTVGVLGLVIGLTVAMLLREERSSAHTPPELIVEFPLTPGLERLLRPEPPSRPPFFHQQFDEVATVYLAGLPSRRVPSSS